MTKKNSRKKTKSPICELLAWTKEGPKDLIIGKTEIDHYYDHTDPKIYRGFWYLGYPTSEQKFTISVGPHWTVPGTNVIIPLDGNMSSIRQQIAWLIPPPGMLFMIHFGIQDVYILAPPAPHILLENDFNPTKPVQVLTSIDSDSERPYMRIIG